MRSLGQYIIIYSILKQKTMGGGWTRHWSLITVFGRCHRVLRSRRSNGLRGRVLFASGYHQHYLGPGRLQRTTKNNNKQTTFAHRTPVGSIILLWVWPAIPGAWFLSCSCRLSTIYGRLFGYGRLCPLDFRSTPCTPARQPIVILYCVNRAYCLFTPDRTPSSSS